MIKEIRQDCGSGKQMNRLLQGDVGSGKTLVAVMCMLMALDNCCQTCLMAPTEILATQHYETIQGMLGEMGITVALLTGSTKKREREEIHRGLQDGNVIKQIVFLRHARPLPEQCKQARDNDTLSVHASGKLHAAHLCGK